MITDVLVLVVDDDRSVRTGLSRVLRGAGYAVEVFEGADQLLGRVLGLGVPCCVVSDVRMPGMGGLALQEELRSRGTPASLVLLSGFADVPTAVRAMKGGALDLLQKPVKSEVLLAAVGEAVAHARREVERRRVIDDLRERYRSLTTRERQVFALVTAGLLNKQVGWELGTREKTVKVQRGSLVQKMGARSLADLVRMADRLGVEPPAAGTRHPAQEPARDARGTPKLCAAAVPSGSPLRCPTAP